MRIYITKGKGQGKTQLSAFDQALFNAGVANYNLIYLSSIIPSNAQIIKKNLKWTDKEYGDKLYTVMSRADQMEIGKDAWAGIGWVQSDDRKGLFVEHHAESKKVLLRLITNSLQDMMRYRRIKYGPIKFETCGVRCTEKPVCALVLAVFQSEGWD